jgi:CubicO group peptidase (beta-lactamase class C family)
MTGIEFFINFPLRFIPDIIRFSILPWGKWLKLVVTQQLYSFQLGPSDHASTSGLFPFFPSKTLSKVRYQHFASPIAAITSVFCCAKAPASDRGAVALAVGQGNGPKGIPARAAARIAAVRSSGKVKRMASWLVILFGDFIALCIPRQSENPHKFLTSTKEVSMLQSANIFRSFVGTRRFHLADFQAAINRLNATIERDIQSLNCPGLAIGIANRERLLLAGEHGFANCDSQNPVTPDTLFQIGSISKAFTSIVFLQLQEEGILDINDPVTKYLPWFLVQSEFSPITLRHLMSHTAGIITGLDDTISTHTETWLLRHTRATAPPGEMFHYSNSGYKVLGLVLEAILQQPFSQILLDRVLHPLGMDASEPAITHKVHSRLAVGYEAYYDDRPLPRGGRLTPATRVESNAADGSICSTAEDMCRYLGSLLNHGKGVLTKESFQLLIHPIIPTGDDLHGEHYGLGLCIHQIDGHQVIGHSGGNVGYTADIIADLDAGLGVVVLTNGPGNPEKLSLYAMRLLLASEKGEEQLPDLLVEPKGVQLEDYVGTYHGENRSFTLTVRNELLYLHIDGENHPLEQQSLDLFLAPHSSFKLFPLRFNRDDVPTQSGVNNEIEMMVQGKQPITSIICGSEIFTRIDMQKTPKPAYPEEWEAYPGHYRSHNPWYSNFRVVLRNGELYLIEPSGTEEPLSPLESGRFRVGANPLSPEFIRFEAILDGKASIAHLSGGAYSRTFTP